MMTRAEVRQSETDVRNAAFWNELCGSALARSLGITDSTPESLRKFDDAYMAMYPYLSRYVTEENLTGRERSKSGWATERSGSSSRRVDVSTTASTSPTAQSR